MEEASLSRQDKYVLIVSEDESICRLFSEALKQPMLCESASRADEAAERLQQRDYSVLVLDLTSPNLRAHELLHEIQRKKREIRPLTFVLVDDTATLPQDLDPKVVTMVIAKPFDMDEIKSMIRQTLTSLVAVATDDTRRGLDSQPAEPVPTMGEPGMNGVLVVDDDRSVQNLIVAALRHEGLEAQGVNDGAQAIEALLKGKGRFCAIILDLMMPKVSGWDVIDWLKANPELVPRSVIVSTAADRTMLHELEPGIVNAIFVKPFNALELAGYVRACARLEGRDRRSKRMIGAERQILR